MVVNTEKYRFITEKSCTLKMLQQYLLQKGLSVDIQGNAEFVVTSLSTLQGADATSLSFVINARYRRLLASTEAGAIVLSKHELPQWIGNALVTNEPQLAWAHIVRLLTESPKICAEIHPTAVIADQVKIGENVTIGAYVVIEADCVIGDHCVIDAHTFLGKGVYLGDNCHLYPRVTILHDCILGKRVTIHSGAIIGSEGFGFAPSKEGYIKIPQLGRVVIHDDVDIGANTTVDRGAMNDTVIERGAKLDNQIQVAHNVQIGEHSIFASCTGISGSTKIGKHCMIGGGVGFAGHLDIADGTVLTGFAMVTHSISEPGIYSSGIPVLPNKDWHKLIGRLKRIEKMHDRLVALENIYAQAGEINDSSDN